MSSHMWVCVCFFDTYVCKVKVFSGFLSFDGTRKKVQGNSQNKWRDIYFVTISQIHAINQTKLESSDVSTKEECVIFVENILQSLGVLLRSGKVPGSLSCYTKKLLRTNWISLKYMWKGVKEYSLFNKIVVNVWFKIFLDFTIYRGRLLILMNDCR